MSSNTFDFEQSFRAGHFESERDTNMILTDYGDEENSIQDNAREEWVPLAEYPVRTIRDFLIERQMRFLLNDCRDDHLPWDIAAAARLYNSLRQMLSEPTSMPVAAASVNRTSSNTVNREQSPVLVEDHVSETDSDDSSDIIRDLDILENYSHYNF